MGSLSEDAVYPIIPGAHESENSILAQAPGPPLSLHVVRTDAGVEPEGLATCPMCHKVDVALTNVSLAAGEYWRCGRCGSKWDQARLATVAAYAAWDLVHQRHHTQR